MQREETASFFFHEFFFYASDSIVGENDGVDFNESSVVLTPTMGRATASLTDR